MDLDANQLTKCISAAPVDSSRWLAEHQPATGKLPCDPWDRWLIVALSRHLARQAFAAEVVQERLSGSPDELGRLGALGHPRGIAQHGRVPGLEDWEYIFHGRGCRLTHDDGMSIDVDFDEHGCSTIDPYFYGLFLKSLPEPDLLESRLRGPEKAEDCWMASLTPLRDAKFLEGEHRVRLSPAAVAWGKVASTALRDCRDGDVEQMAWLACQIEDYPLAQFLLSDKTPQRIAAKAQLQRIGRAESLMRRLGGDDVRSADSCLAALWQLNPEYGLTAAVNGIEFGDSNSSWARCVYALTKWGNASHVDFLLQCLGSLTGDDLPKPLFRCKVAHFVMSFHRSSSLPEADRDQLLVALGEHGQSSEADAAFLSFLLDPGSGMSRLERGLTSSIPCVRTQSAAALGLIGTDKVVEVLLRAGTAEAEVILSLLRGEEPVGAPVPGTEPIERGGELRPLYSSDELRAAELTETVLYDAHAFREEHEALLLRWSRDETVGR